MRQDRDLVLPPNTYAFVLDTTKGNVSAYVGPRSGTLSPTDRLVTWTGKRFVPTTDFNQAIQPFIKAAEGQYVILTDPASDDSESFPREGTINTATPLDAGRKIVLPGPVSFALWPGQTAQVLPGHTLNLNQYLVAQVYEPDAAQENMERAIAAPSAGEGESESVTEAREFTMGERIVIRGTEVSFYIPPTGIEVLPEDNRSRYVRDAASLESLEYCVLVGEDGKRRYERGPAVVFPGPTETFIEEKGSRKFRAIELNPQSALYIKALADHEFLGDQYQEGDEIFVTGEKCPIYFPRPEHSVIHYGNQRKHHAVAIPAGEGRYVLDRERGQVDLVEGPQMFLPDPRKQVVVRRVLDEKATALMYPGNVEAAQVNAQLRSERFAKGEEFLSAEPVMAANLASTGESGALATSYFATSTFAGDKMRRSTSYTPPRTITLDTKYHGAVTVSVWPGYAVLVIDKTGNRRVEQGPTNLLLQYDESLMAMALSTGRPKGTGQPFRTVYLRTVNNAVGDLILVETKDLVPVVMELSLRVNFEEENSEKWFDVEDYVALLTDHCRSRLRNVAKRHGIEKFYSETIDIVRDALLGEVTDGKRAGLTFAENGMRLVDVEVLTVKIEHAETERLLASATQRALEGTIQLSEAEQEAERQKRLEEIQRERLASSNETAEVRSQFTIQGITRTQKERLEEIAANLAAAAKRGEVEEVRRAEELADAEASVQIMRGENEVALERLRGEVEQYVKRMAALNPAFIAAINDFGDKAFVDQLVSALGPAALATGVTSADLLDRAFKGTPFESITQALSDRPYARAINGAATD